MVLSWLAVYGVEVGPDVQRNLISPEAPGKKKHARDRKLYSCGDGSVANEVGRHFGLRHSEGHCCILAQAEFCARRGWKHTSIARHRYVWSPEFLALTGVGQR